MPAVFDMTLASKRYVLAGPVVREPIPDLAQQWRSGAPDYSDRQGAQYYEWEDLSGGLGLEIIDCNNDEDRRRTWTEYGVDTRQPGEVTLGPLVQVFGQLVPAASNHNYGRFLDIPGALLFASQSVSWNCTVWRNAATSWNCVYNATATNANLGRSWRFPVPNGIEQDIYLGTGGALFTSPIGGLSFAAVGSVSFPARGLGYDFGEETLLCQKTKDDGKLYTVTGHPTTPVATAIGYLGGLVGDMVTFYDQDGALVPYISVFKAPSGDNTGKPLASLYRVDLLEEKLYPVSDGPPAAKAPTSAETWQNIVVWNGWLYMFLKDQLYRYQPGKWETVPPRSTKFAGRIHDALPFIITAMAATPRWLYLWCQADAAGSSYMVAVGPGGDWHGLARDSLRGATPLAYSDEWSPERLWFYGEPGGVAPDAMQYVELPKTAGRPSDTAGYKYTDSGVFRLAWFDGRFAEIEGTALRLSIVGEGMSETETVAPTYAVNGTGAAVAALGTMTGTVFSADFASGVGIPFKTIQLQFVMARGASLAQSPKIRRIVFTYLKKPPIRYRYTAAIEVKATRTALRSIETLLAEFETVYDATTLQQLKYGRVSTYINLKAINFIERPPATKTGQRNVYQIQLVMEEPI